MEINKGICPICGKENNCAFVKGMMHEGCWCEKIKVPTKLLEKVPEDVKGKACVCKNCVMQFIESEQEIR